MSKHCRDAKKRKYNSKAAALRAGTDRYGVTSNAYQCVYCDRWHLTRKGTPKPTDPQLDAIVDAALGRKAS